MSRSLCQLCAEASALHSYARGVPKQAVLRALLLHVSSILKFLATSLKICIFLCEVSNKPSHFYRCIHKTAYATYLPLPFFDIMVHLQLSLASSLTPASFATYYITLNLRLASCCSGVHSESLAYRLQIYLSIPIYILIDYRQLKNNGLTSNITQLGPHTSKVAAISANEKLPQPRDPWRSANRETNTSYSNPQLYLYAAHMLNPVAPRAALRREIPLKLLYFFETHGVFLSLLDFLYKGLFLALSSPSLYSPISALS